MALVRSTGEPYDAPTGSVLPPGRGSRLPSSTSNASLSDPELVLRVRAGDDRALSELYDRHAGLVFNLARAVVGTEADAEEVTEDVFVQLWTSADRFDPNRGALRSWLATLARSRALDRLRAAKRQRATLERAAAADEKGMAVTLSEPDRADASAMASEVRAALDGALSILNPDQRRAIELAYLGGLSQSEIADRLSEPLGTVKTRIRDGMARLRDSFKGGGGLLA